MIMHLALNSKEKKRQNSYIIESKDTNRKANIKNYIENLAKNQSNRIF